MNKTNSTRIFCYSPDRVAEQDGAGIYSETGAGAYIGLSDAVQEKDWRWSDGSPLDFTSWGHSQPDNWPSEYNNDTEDCAVLWTAEDFKSKFEWTDSWVDVKCSDQNSYICSYNPNGN